MELEVIRKLIKKYVSGHADFIKRADVAERYFRNKNDILHKEVKSEKEAKIRNADNRISTNFYGLLVRQKASYMFTAPPVIDVGNKGANKKIYGILGDKYSKVFKDLCINASNSGIGWLHVWKDEQGGLKYSVIDSRQIIPVWSSDLMDELSAVFRTYYLTDENGDKYKIYEYWNENSCFSFKQKSNDGIEMLDVYNMFTVVNDGILEESNVYKHDFNTIPFIPFFNNSEGMSDLDNVKALIDCYDKVFSGFLNDLEDIQEIIFVLKGYDGTDLSEFLNDLGTYKTIKLNELEHSALETITINIPVEARKEMLTMCRKAIFEQGQGVDSDPQNFGNSSGVALKFMYSLLELKAGIMETEFRLSLNKFIKLIGVYLGIQIENINQTWNRTAITNDNDLSTIAKESVGIVSNKTILKNHPFVENVEEEEKQLELEKQKSIEEYNSFDNTFNGKPDKGVTDNAEEENQ